MSRIDIGLKDNYDILEKTKVNDRRIIQLVIGSCRTYFHDDSNVDYKYILFSRKMNEHKRYRLIGIYNDIDETDPAYIEISENMDSAAKVLASIIKKYHVKKIDLDRLFYNKPGCGEPLDLTKANDLLRTLNHVISKECRDIRLNLDYVYNMKNKVVSFTNTSNYLVLCLYYKEDCISSIEIVEKNQHGLLEINSKTETIHEGKKYNKLLRAVAIMIAGLLVPGASYVSSVAVNPISAWLLVNSFNGIIQQTEDNEEYFAYIKETYGDVPPPKITFKMLQDFYNKYTGIYVDVELKPDNLVNTSMQFVQIVNEMVCERRTTKSKSKLSSPTSKTRRSRSPSPRSSPTSKTRRSKSKSKSKSPK